MTAEERAAFSCLDAARKTDRTVRAYRGRRISEALALTTVRIDSSGKAIVFETLKKRRRGVYRAFRCRRVPKGTLKWFMASEARQGRQSGPKRSERNGTGYARPPWRRVQVVMDAAGIEGGLHKCPKRLRHGYGVHAISSGVPLNLAARMWHRRHQSFLPQDAAAKSLEQKLAFQALPGTLSWLRPSQTS